MWDPYAEFQTVTLPNGLSVHAAHWPGRPWEAMGFLIHSGAEYDPVGLEGLSHFVEHVVSGNTNLSRKEMGAFFEDCGGSVNLGTTSHLGTDFSFFVPANKTVLSGAFSMFGHMLLSAKLEKFIEHDRQVIVEEFNRSYPVKLKLDMEMRMHKALYAGYWLERLASPLGNLESISQITPSDLQSHYDEHYTPANMSIVGVGGMQLLELVELLSESPFATSKKGTRTPLPKPTTNATSPTEAHYVLEMSALTSIPIKVGSYHSAAKIPGNVSCYAISIVEEMLDDVLNEEVREQKGWAYAISSSQTNFRHFYEFSINCGAFALEALGDIEKVIESCIASINDREDLFEQVKCQTLANKFMTDTTGRDVRNNALKDLVKNERIISLEEEAGEIKRVKMEDIRNAAWWLRPEQRWTLITRP